MRRDMGISRAERLLFRLLHLYMTGLGKAPDAGKDWGQGEKEMTEDEMAGWHHWLNGHEFEQAPGAGDGRGGLVCRSPWVCKELDTTGWLNWIELNWWRAFSAKGAPPLPHHTSQSGQGRLTEMKSEACLMVNRPQLVVSGVTLSSQWMKKVRTVKRRSKQWQLSVHHCDFLPPEEVLRRKLLSLPCGFRVLCWESFI